MPACPPWDQGVALELEHDVLKRGGCAKVCHTTQYRSVSSISLAIESWGASLSIENRNSIFENPTGTVLSTPSVPRKSRSPQASTEAARISIPIAVATAARVTPAHETIASKRISPEQAKG